MHPDAKRKQTWKESNLQMEKPKGKLSCLSNRRLTALMMYQSLHRDSCIKAWCEIVSHDTEKFDEANDTLNDGLGIEFRPGQF